MDRFFNSDGDLFLNFAGARTTKLHANFDLVNLWRREKLLVELWNACETTDDKQHHQQVARNRVLDKPCDGTVHIN